MSVNPASPTGPVGLNPISNDQDSGGTKPNSKDGGRKIDPNTEDQVLQAAIGGFLPGMISNTLMLNNSLFNFSKEALDEADQ